MPAAPKPERRMIDLPLKVESRAEGEEAKKLVGYAAIFDEVADIGGWFLESIRRGAFARSLERGDDVRALWNHDASAVLGRTKSGTLRLSEDERGLRVEIDPPDTQLGRDMMHLVERGDVSQMSFGFLPVVTEWNEGNLVRTLVEVDLFDVSLVAFPAYDGTEIALRSQGAAVLEAQKRSAVKTKHALMRMRLRLAEIS